VRWRIALAGVLLTALLTPALARDNGQFDNVAPDTCAWFKSARPKKGKLRFLTLFTIKRLPKLMGRIFSAALVTTRLNADCVEFWTLGT
jgi:hypothetical protein